MTLEDSAEKQGTGAGLPFSKQKIFRVGILLVSHFLPRFSILILNVVTIFNKSFNYFNFYSLYLPLH